MKSASTGDKPKFFVSSAHPRIVDGKPTKNPRYLQTRPDLLNERALYLEQISMRLHRKLQTTHPLYSVVDAVVPGRRNNPADVKAGIQPLAVYNPIHFMELPELLRRIRSK